MAKLKMSFDNYSQSIIYSKGAKPVLEVGRSFSFVLNVGELEGDTLIGLPLGQGLTLRRASDGEIAAIKDVLTEHAGTTSFQAWEHTRVSTGKNRHSYEPLPTDQRKYFLFDFDGSDSQISELDRAMSLATFELKLGFTVLQEPYEGSQTVGLLFDPGRLFSQTRRAAAGALEFVSMTQARANELACLRQELHGCDEGILNLKKLMGGMLELDSLPYQSSLLFLGHFAILESLLTHAPNPKDTIDSITRQVKSKLALLDNRWDPRLDYSKFKGAKPDAVWSKMYNYRSCLAHGSEPDFKGDLQLLGDKFVALKLLRQAVRAVLRVACGEPQLVVDLRNC